jgi:septum formation protein
MSEFPFWSRPPQLRIVLGSQSPRRRELLAGLLGGESFDVVAPRLEMEPDFEGLTSLEAIDERLLYVARLKYRDVTEQLAAQGTTGCVVAADTVVVGLDATGRPEVCGKPPEGLHAAAATLRRWFGELYAGRRHLAKTGLCVGVGETVQSRIVTTEVWFREDAPRFVTWYLATGEPWGKAGGYAVQGMGSLFVEGLRGSLSNVVGLPLVETLELLATAEVWGSSTPPE